VGAERRGQRALPGARERDGQRGAARGRALRVRVLRQRQRRRQRRRRLQRRQLRVLTVTYVSLDFFSPTSSAAGSHAVDSRAVAFIRSNPRPLGLLHAGSFLTLSFFVLAHIGDRHVFCPLWKHSSFSVRV